MPHPGFHFVNPPPLHSCLAEHFLSYAISKAPLVHLGPGEQSSFDFPEAIIEYSIQFGKSCVLWKSWQEQPFLKQLLLRNSCHCTLRVSPKLKRRQPSAGTTSTFSFSGIPINWEGLIQGMWGVSQLPSLLERKLLLSWWPHKTESQNPMKWS